MRPMGEVIGMLVMLALAFGLGYLVRASLGTLYILTDKEIPDSIRAQLWAARAEREATKWQEDGLLVDVLTELCRLLKEEKIQQTMKEDRHGRPAAAPPTDRA
jgi:hypothetical protein